MSSRVTSLVRMRRVRSLLRGSAAGFAAAVLAISIVSITAVMGAGTFRSSEPRDDGSFWHRLFADRATVGFVRAALVVFAVYVVASGAALITTGRWIRSVKTTGFDVDDPRELNEMISALRAENETARKERDEAQRLLWRSLGG